jgi:hypothetical protein
MKDASAGGRGQSVLEILIALAIVALSASSAVAVLFSGRSLLLDAQMENRALNLARQDFETSRATGQTNFSGLANSSSISGDFTRETVVESVNSYTKKVTNKVSWKTNPLRTQKVELVTLVTDWRNISPPADPGDSGGGGISGDWKNPTTLGSVDLGPGNSATDLDVINKIVYMSAEAAAEEKPDFFIVDAANGQNPTIISSLNTGPSLNAVDVSGNYAYVANRDDDAQLQIIDVSNRSNPTLVSSFDLPGVSGSGAVGQSVFYANSKVYVATKKAEGPEFHIIDVSNPLNPTALGSFEVNGAVNMIEARNNIAYIAWAGDNYELKILDVSNPASVAELSRYNAPGDSEDGKSLYVVGNKLYLGRSLGGNHENHHEFHILDVSSSTSPQNLGSKDLGADLNDLRVRDYLAFLGTSDANKEFQVWNISDPANIALWSSFNFPQMATGVDYEDNLVYVSVRSNDALRIITSQ